MREALAQESAAWAVYTTSKRYRVTVHILRAEIAPADDTLTVATVDPYIVVFVSSDRQASKQKTPLLHKTLRPVWDHALLFAGLGRETALTLEVKADRPFGTNELLCARTFLLSDFMQHGSDQTLIFQLTGDKAAGLVHARVAFDPPPPSEDGRGAAVYLDVHDGHACVLIDSISQL